MEAERRHARKTLKHWKQPRNEKLGPQGQTFVKEGGKEKTTNKRENLGPIET